MAPADKCAKLSTGLTEPIAGPIFPNEDAAAPKAEVKSSQKKSEYYRGNHKNKHVNHKERKNVKYNVLTNGFFVISNRNNGTRM